MNDAGKKLFGRHAEYDETSGAWITNIERVWLDKNEAVHRDNDLPAVERFAESYVFFKLKKNKSCSFYSSSSKY